jgi:hypothetical protein
MQAKLENWNIEIDKLNAKVGEVTTDILLEYYEQIESLKVMQSNARLKIEEFKQSRENAWKDLTSAMDQSWKTMDDALHSALSRFK